MPRSLCAPQPPLDYPFAPLQTPGRLGSYNTYGPTEATVITTTALCQPEDDMIHIGVPDTNTHAYIVDGGMNPLPVGVPGELLLRSGGQ